MSFNGFEIFVENSHSMGIFTKHMLDVEVGFPFVESFFNVSWDFRVDFDFFNGRSLIFSVEIRSYR